MALAAKISSAELTAQVTNRFDGAYLEVRLIDAPGVAYLPGTTDDANFLSFEVPAGTSGYSRQVISYTASDVTSYADDGVGLTTRATIFAHDGVGDPIEFSHAVLTWSGGNALTLDAVSLAPSAAVDGDYTNIPIDSTDGSGTGMTVNLTVANSGAAAGDYTVSIVNPGSEYAADDVLTISEGTLVGLGAVEVGAGNLAFSVETVATQSNQGQILAVAQTSNTVQLTGGNEAAFYWNLKQFGFYSVAS